MSRRVRFWCLCSLLALGLMIPAWSSAQEIPGAGAAGEQLMTPNQAPQGVAPDQEPITLEELKKLVGPQKACGALCGPGKPSCYTLCGDAAACVWGRCVWL
jgi:hypothetical protein